MFDCKENRSFILYIFVGSTALFFLSTIFLAFVLIVVLVRNSRRNRSADITRVGKGKVNPSYWIADYDLNNKISASTPNLSEWSRPSLPSRPTKTFFSSLMAEENICGGLERTGGLVSSMSMAPLSKNVRSLPKIRKSVSYGDLDLNDNPPTMSLPPIPERRPPPSPPVRDKKENERLRVVPRKKRDTKSVLLAENESEANEHDEFRKLDYVNVEQFGRAAKNAPLYQHLDFKLRDQPAQYATLAEVTRKK